MLLSIFTPTHDPQHLVEAYDSLKIQDYENWEWVIVPNGGAVGKIPEVIRLDKRVHIFPYDVEAEARRKLAALSSEEREKLEKKEEAEGTPKNDPDNAPEPLRIGALKRFACDHCKGQVFCELDHDDLFVPGILTRVVKEVENGAGFVFSDSAVFLSERGNLPIGYGELHGWETYDFKVYGKTFLATRQFEVTPRSLCEIYYAPDHIRCWTRKAYYDSGGHNADLTVGDDHDLICRTYLKHHRFAHTGSCGYLYRNHPGNTVKSHNEQIQKQQKKNRDNYLYQLLEEWATRTKQQYLDLKGGDVHKLLFWDDGKPTFDIEESSIGTIRAYDFLQFIPQANVVDIMNEIYRILVPGGWFCSGTPSTAGFGAFAPHNKSYWNSYVFLHYCDHDYARQIEEIDRDTRVKCRFQRVRCFDSFPNVLFQRANVKYVYADLCAIKGQRQPGRVDI